MSLSTAYIYDRAVAQMGDMQTKISKTQTQLSTGKQVPNPSDSPEKTTAMQRVQSAIARQDSYLNTLTAVDERLKTEEPVIRNSTEAMARFKELVVQASNDTLSPSDRQALALELKSLREEMLSYANVRDSNGNYLFGGGRVSKPAFSTNAASGSGYEGDTTRMNVNIGDERTVNLNRAGSDIFTSVKRTVNGQTQQVGFFKALDDITAAVVNSNHNGMVSGLNDIDTLQTGLAHALTQMGSDMNAIDSQRSTIEDTKLRLQSTLSSLQDVDYADAISRLKKDMTGLEAAQSSFAQTSKLNLFNFIK
jgi:flagellar hook-associated protein 3 FlgL